MMHRALIACLLAGALMSGAAVAQPIGDVEAGREKSQACIACHGEKGAAQNNPAWPMLAGQHPDYLLHALKAYKSGDRQNAIMNGQAAGLSEQDMRDLAAYFAAQTPAVHGLQREAVSSAE